VIISVPHGRAASNAAAAAASTTVTNSREGGPVPPSARDHATIAPGRLLAAACVLVAAIACGRALGSPRVEADTIGLIDGVRVALDCLQRGAHPCPITAYSLQQTLVAGLAMWNGWTPEAIARLLAALSGVAITLLAVLSVTHLPRRHRALGLGVVVAGPLWFYAGTTFGEALASASLVWFVVCLALQNAPSAGRTLAIAAAAAWASLGKDTMPAIVLLLGTAVVWLDDRRPRGVGSRLGATAAGALAGAVAIAGFHWFRLGTVYNAEYVDHPEFFLWTPADVLSAFLGHWVSPTAGLVWFWPLAAAVLVRSGRDGAVAGAVVVAYAAGLSRWWAPFGWVAWGDRLLYPVVAAAVFLCLTSRSREVRIAPWVWGVSAVAAMAAVAVSEDGRALATFFAPDTTFPGPPTIQADVDLYRAFLRHLTWERRLDAGLLVAGLTSLRGALTAVGVGAAIAMAFVTLASPPRRAGRHTGTDTPPTDGRAPVDVDPI
jgi:hypothetical protein